MQPEERDTASLWDMLHALRTIGEYVRGKSYAEFEDDLLVQDAVVRRLTILGEAAMRLSPERRQSLPGITWKTIIGMRNVVVHQYDKVILERIWLTATEDVPQLEQVLAGVLASQPDPPPAG
jgi:uncharacterized protein with HEPN domain